MKNVSNDEPGLGGARPKPRRRWLRLLKWFVISVVLLVVMLVFGVAPFLLAGLITNASTRPMDRALAGTPADYGVKYQDIEFKTADGVTLSGWYMPSDGKQVTIIYSHGLFRSRREMLERAVRLWKLGYGALLYDARNHGVSGRARTSLGYSERKDVEGAITYIRDVGKSSDRIVLLGVSMGAVADLLAAAETPEVAAVISDSSFLNFDDTVKHHLKLFFHLPAFPLAYEIEYLTEHKAGFNGTDLSPLQAVKRMGDRPILFIAGAHDPRMPPSVAETLRKASLSPKSELLVVDGQGSNRHGHSYFVNPDLYISKVTGFLDSVFTEDTASHLASTH